MVCRGTHPVSRSLACLTYLNGTPAAVRRTGVTPICAAGLDLVGAGKGQLLQVQKTTASSSTAALTGRKHHACMSVRPLLLLIGKKNVHIKD